MVDEKFYLASKIKFWGVIHKGRRKNHNIPKIEGYLNPA